MSDDAQQKAIEALAETTEEMIRVCGATNS
jgi:hypothetical protein